MASSRLFAQTEPLDLEAIPRSDDYILRSWVTRDGMPDAPIQNLTQTPNGYLWLGGVHVLMRFDGVRFTAFPEASGSKPNGTSVVLTARDGTLWAAFGEGGLTRLRNGRFQVVIPTSATRNRPILSLAEDAGGGISASFSRGGDILRWKDGKTDSFRVGNGGNPISLCSATNGVIWFTSYTRYGFFNGREFQSLPLANRGCGHLAASRAGGVWTVAGRQLLHLWDNGKSEVVAELSWLGEAAQVTALYEDRAGNLWIGSQGAGGLVRFRDGKFERVPTSFFLINHLYQTRDGNLWVATGGGSLDCLSPRQILLHAAPVDRSPNPVGPRDIRVSSLAVDEKGRVWMTQGQSLVRATDATNRKFAVAPGWTGPHGVFSLRSTPSGEIWMGGGPHGLWCWKDARLQSEVPLPGSLASFLLGDVPHQIWAAVKPNPGVYEYRGKDFTLLPESAGIPNPVALALDLQKRLWVGTTDGRVYYRQGTSFVEAPMPEPKPGDLVVFLVPDGPDTVWIGCDQSGLYRWRSGRIDKLPPDAGLPSRNLSVLEIEPNGNFWFGALVGLIRVSRAELDAVLDGRQSTVQAVTYGPNLGMPTTAGFHYGFLHSARTLDGHLWFGTTVGGLEVLPEYVPASAAPPAVLIEEILVRGKSVPLPSGSTSLVLPPRPGTIQIRYTLPELGALEQVRFRFRMLGLGDDAWSSNDPQRIATFSNLPPGSYTFEVAAANPSAASPPKTASFSLTVRAAWWETLWFRLACVGTGAIAIALLVTVLVRRRTQARIRRLEQENALDRERARIARDMHDELGASLTHIMLMSELASQKSDLAALPRIVQKARSVSSTLDQIVWTTNPRNDTLGQLVGYIVEFAREYLANTDITLHLELPQEVPTRQVSSEKRHHLLQVAKEALNNIAKHSDARTVHLGISLQSDELRIVIQDDGRGFDPSAISPHSNGLLNMRHRIAEIAGTLTIESQPDRGTTVTLSVKI